MEAVVALFRQVLRCAIVEVRVELKHVREVSSRRTELATYLMNHRFEADHREKTHGE